MPNFTITPSPLGSQLTSTIGMDDGADKNDFAVYITADGNVTEFEQTDITLSAGYSIQAFSGSGCSYAVTIRPPTTAGVLTVSIAENAVPEGNPATSQTIRVSTAFPDADAESATHLFDAGDNHRIITVTDRYIYTAYDSTDTLKIWTHSGIEVSTESVTALQPNTVGMTFFNDSLLQGNGRITLNGFNRTLLNFTTALALTQTRLGITGFDYTVNPPVFEVQPYGTTESGDKVTITPTNLTQNATRVRSIAHQNDLMYFTFNGQALAEVVSDTEIRFIKDLNINHIAFSTIQFTDIAIYRDTLFYIVGDGTTSQRGVYTLDIKPYRPLAKNTKTTIPVQSANEGDTLPLSQFSPDASDFIFDTGFDLPDYLSINANNELAIASDAVTETTPVLVKMRGINFIDSEPFSFYLIIRQTTAPVPREFDNLSMRANSTFDLHQVVDAETIVFESGQTQPTGSSIDDGIFTIGTQGGDAYFTATRDGLSTNFQFNVDVIQPPNPDNFSEQFRHRVEIRGIDVTDDVPNFPEISKTTDAIALNEYRNDTATLILSDDGGKYNPDIADNFWGANNLNTGGFREPIKVYVENLVGGSYVSSLLFSGVIYEQAESISDIEARLRCREIAYVLKQANVSDFGTNEKWDALRQQSDESSFEGVYIPETALTPMQIGTGKAWRDRAELDISRIALQSEGQTRADTAYMTTNELRTAGGFLADNPVMRFKTRHLSEDVRFLWNQLAINKGVYNTFIDLPDVVLNDPFILNRGSVSFGVEDTRITRLITDWVHDTTNGRVLMLLSNPEGHIADMLVSYRIESDSYRTLYTFDKDVKAWRIERRDATNYYILTSDAITQDRSAQTLPRTDDKAGYGYDSRAEGSVIRIHHYNATTNALTEFVAEDNDRPPQLGVHYHAGFENAVYVDEFEGITPYDRGAFVWYDSNLYYRYATTSGFGVARADTSGTTTALISQTDLNYHNWLNFAFDVDTSNGDTFMVHASGMSSESSLVIRKRDSSGTITTVLTDTKTLQAFSDLSGGGAYLGAHEAVFHNDNLYFIAPIQRVNESSGTYSRSQAKSAGAVLYKCDVNAGTPALTSLVSFDFIQRAGCGLVVHDGNVHYTELPIVSSMFRAINEDL